MAIRFSTKVPEGDERERRVCEQCGFVDYVNPKIVVGSVAIWDDKVLLCKRAIEPRVGHWTLPAGFLELGESPAEGAAREAEEEARATIQTTELFAVYTIRHISQVQMFFRATLTSPAIEAGPESQEVRLFAWDEIPTELAFPSVTWALDDYRANAAGPVHRTT